MNTRRIRSNTRCITLADLISGTAERGAFGRPFSILPRWRPNSAASLPCFPAKVAGNLMGPRMIKTAKSARRTKSEPDIWSEGKQFVPVDAGHLSRVAAILARRLASRSWLRGSVRTADFAMAVEDGLGAALIGRMGSVGRILPSRGAVARLLARVSRLEATASALVDHQAQPVAPLELGDLRAFMQQRRAEAQIIAAEQARKDSIAQAARERAASLARRKLAAEAETLVPLVQTGAVAEAAEPVEVVGAHVVAVDEMQAIRMALASIPEVVAPVVVAAPPPPVAPVRLFAAKTEDWSDLADLSPETAPLTPPITPPPGLALRIGKVAMRLTGRVLAWILHGIWRLIGPLLTKIVATTLGWGLVGFLLPYGFYGSISAHLKGQDLRYFD